MAAATTRIAELSSLIARETAKLDEFLRAENLPTPSLDENALESLPIPDRRPDIKEARLSVMEACSELKDLLTGPKELLRFPVAPVPRLSTRPLYC